MTAPPNDDFANAQTLYGLGELVSEFDTSEATVEEGEPAVVDASWEAWGPYDTSIGATVWFTWSPPSDGEFTLTTVGSDFDTVIAVYEGFGPGLTGLSLIAANDEGEIDQYGNDLAWPPGWSRVGLTLTASTTYYIQAGGFGGNTGLLTLSVSEGLPPPPPPPMASDDPDLEWEVAYNNPTSFVRTGGYLGGAFVFATNQPSAIWSYEADGPWTNTPFPTDIVSATNGIRSNLAYGNGTYVGIGDNFPGETHVVWSCASLEDGWYIASQVPIVPGDGPAGVAYLSGKWVFLTYKGFVYESESPEGPWTIRADLATLTASLPSASNWGYGHSLTVLDGQLVATTRGQISVPYYSYSAPGYINTNSYNYAERMFVWTATDASDWTNRSAIGQNDWYGYSFSRHPIRKYDEGYFLNSPYFMYTSPSLDGPWTRIAPWREWLPTIPSYWYPSLGVAAFDRNEGWLIYAFSYSQSPALGILTGDSLTSLSFRHPADGEGFWYFDAGDEGGLAPVCDGAEFVIPAQSLIARAGQGEWGITLA